MESSVSSTDELRALGLAPLWRQTREFLPTGPRPGLVTAWHFARDVRPALLRTAETVSMEEAERRVLLLCADDPDGFPRTTPTMVAGMQLLLPGETAPAHRHTPAALRVMVEGTGVVTIVDGERTEMSPGDVVLTPSCTWHEHAADASAGPVIWLDGLDLPLVRFLEAIFFEQTERHQTVTRSSSGAAPGPAHALVHTADAARERPYSPVVNYPWRLVSQALDALAEERGEAMVSTSYLNPSSGGPVMPTLDCTAHRVAPGGAGTFSRSTVSRVVHVAEGDVGVITAAGRIDLGTKDVAVLPSWTDVELRNDEIAPAKLISFSDEPVLRSLGLFRTTWAPAAART